MKLVNVLINTIVYPNGPRKLLTFKEHYNVALLVYAITHAWIIRHRKNGVLDLITNFIPPTRFHSVMFTNFGMHWFAPLLCIPAASPTITSAMRAIILLGQDVLLYHVAMTHACSFSTQPKHVQFFPFFTLLMLPVDNIQMAVLRVCHKNYSITLHEPSYYFCSLFLFSCKIISNIIIILTSHSLL